MSSLATLTSTLRENWRNRRSKFVARGEDGLPSPAKAPSNLRGLDLRDLDLRGLEWLGYEDRRKRNHEAQSSHRLLRSAEHRPAGLDLWREWRRRKTGFLRRQ